MTHALQNFEFNTHQLNVIVDDAGEPWFIAKQVAEILEYSDAEAMTRRLDDDEVQNRQIVGFGNRGVNLINESGLYSAILTSQKPAAKTFKRWVTHEVLPSIRKTGGYMPAETQHLITAQAEYIKLANEHINALTENNALRAQIADYQNRTPGIMRAWQADEDEHLKNSLANGLGPTAIGIELGRSRDSVCHRIKLLKKRGEIE